MTIKKAVKKTAVAKTVVIAAPNLQTMDIKIEGTAPYVQNAFGHKAATEMLQKQMEGSTARGKKKHAPRDIDLDYQEATHFDENGKCGIPAPAFRSAMISACRLVGFQMTKAKLSVFVIADAIDAADGTPLVHITGKREMHKGHVRLETGVASIAIRPMWREWSAKVRVKWDADQFTEQDVLNLMARAGQQVGVGEGRPDSKKSHGMGWGVFKIVN